MPVEFSRDAVLGTARLLEWIEGPGYTAQNNYGFYRKPKQFAKPGSFKRPNLAKQFLKNEYDSRNFFAYCIAKGDTTLDYGLPTFDNRIRNIIDWSDIIIKGASTVWIPRPRIAKMKDQLFYRVDLMEKVERVEEVFKVDERLGRRKQVVAEEPVSNAEAELRLKK
jgi:hypothetical protein